MVLSFGYKDLVGISGFSGLERIEKQIKEYNLYAVLETCAKISITLLHRGIANPLGQAELLSGIFPDKAQRLKYYGKARARAAGSAWAIFNQQSVLTLVKIATMHCNYGKGKSVKPKDMEQLGYWLLHINDECFAKESGAKIALPSREHERDRLREALARYQFFHASERLGYKIGRFKWIVDYFKSSKPHGIDIEKLFYKATKGISLDDYMTICSSLLVKWVNISTKKIDLTKDWITCTEVYFRKTKLDKNSIDKVLDMIAMLPQDYKVLYEESVEEVLGGQEQFHYNFLPFAWKPLVWFQDKKCFICPSAEYLFDKVTEGIYRTIETSLRQEKHDKTRNTFSTAWGDAFEQYVNSCLNETFGRSYYPNLIDKKTKEQKIDGLINSSNFIFLIETKSMHWSYKTIVSGKLEAAEIQLKQLFIEKGLRQITRCIRNYKSGKWNLPVDTKGKEFIPVLVVSEGMPQDAYNRRLYENVAERARSIVHDKDVLPFIIITAEEVEILEAVVKEKGVNEAIQILAEYSHMYLRKNEIGLTPESIGLKNYMYYKGYENPSKPSNNKRLLSYFNDVMDDVCLRAFGRKLEKKRKKRAKQNDRT